MSDRKRSRVDEPSVRSGTGSRSRNAARGGRNRTTDRPHGRSRSPDGDSHGSTDAVPMTDGGVETTDHEELVEDLLAGKHRALARVITKIENRSPGYREIVSRLHDHTGSASVVGITGSPGAGKSTLVDKLAVSYRERGETVGVIAVDPSSPYTGGAVLGDRIRMASNVGDMDVFFRSMSARGSLGGLSTATSDAVKALDAFGKDRIIVETVGAGQNEVDIVKTAETVCVLVQPGSGDDVQMLKAGILEIGDVFVVNKADMEGADRTVAELEEMLHMRDDPMKTVSTGHHGPMTDSPHAAGSAGHGRSESHDPSGSHGTSGSHGASGSHDTHGDAGHGDGGHGGADHGDDDVATDETGWEPEVLRTVATSGEGVDELIETFDAHREWLEQSGELAAHAQTRYAEEIRQLLRADTAELIEEIADQHGGVEQLAARVADRETDPYAITEELLAPVIECVHEDD